MLSGPFVKHLFITKWY